MNYFLRGITYSYNRNIGWQDRTILTLLGIAALAGSIYFFSANISLSIVLAVLAVAQFGTVLSARCIICYFMGKCTIDSREKFRLQKRGIEIEIK